MAETAQAKEVLAEAAVEMEKIRLEKKQLLHQWKSSHLAVQRRDEHLQGVDKALRGVQQQELALQATISQTSSIDIDTSISNVLYRYRYWFLRR
jgi:hypothetical protein